MLRESNNNTELTSEMKHCSSSLQSYLEFTPTRPKYSYLVIPTPVSPEDSVLLCDPLTGLVAYPSFEQYLINFLPQLALNGIHFAIGDVDDLRTYVLDTKHADPTMFGHLAGNDCMRRIGDITRKWVAEVLDDWPLLVCATFGGDEVIITAAGNSYKEFVRSVNNLVNRIQLSAPRPCSFASITTVPTIHSIRNSTAAYRQLVSCIDAALFSYKNNRRVAGMDSKGKLIDIGLFNLE